MKYRKSIQSLICGLGAAVLLLACLPTAALAASKQHEDPREQAQTVPGRQWLREKENTAVGYYGPKEAGNPQYEQPPAFRPTWLPEGWTLDDTWVASKDHVLSSWRYRKSDAELEFTCYLRCDGYIGMALYDREVPTRLGTTGPEVKLQQAQVQGRSADFYQAGSHAYLFWEDSSGNLFVLDGELDRASMVQMADSVKEVKDQTLPEYQLGWEPEGAKSVRRDTMPGAVMLHVEKDVPEFTNVPFYTFLYAVEPLKVPEGKPETVKVKGAEAQYWKGVQQDELTSLWPTQEKLDTLLWKDSETNITFRLQGVLGKDVMLRMAESVIQVTSAAQQPQKETPAAAPAPAQTDTDFSKKLEEAKKIAYQDLEKASPEMQAKILEARKIIINSTSWVADGYNGSMGDGKGGWVSLPHFSDLFPGWEMPKA